MIRQLAKWIAEAQEEPEKEWMRAGREPASGEMEIEGQENRRDRSLEEGRKTDDTKGK